MILPTHVDIRQARQEIGLSEKQCAKLVLVTETTWQRWESSPSNDEHRQISCAAWESFLIQTHMLRPSESCWRVQERDLE